MARLASKTSTVFAFVIATTLLLPDVHAESPTASLVTAQKAFLEISKDFLDFAKTANATGQRTEYEAAYELAAVARNAMNMTILASRLAEIHGLVCVVDKAKVSPIVTFEFDGIQKQIDVEIQATNLNITATQSQAIVQRGGELRSQLRMLQSTVRKFFGEGA